MIIISASRRNLDYASQAPLHPGYTGYAGWLAPFLEVDGEERASSLPSNTASSSLSLAINLRIPAFVNPFSPIG